MSDEVKKPEEEQEAEKGGFFRWARVTGSALGTKFTTEVAAAPFAVVEFANKGLGAIGAPKIPGYTSDEVRQGVGRFFQDADKVVLGLDPLVLAEDEKGTYNAAGIVGEVIAGVAMGGGVGAAAMRGTQVTTRTVGSLTAPRTAAAGVDDVARGATATPGMSANIPTWSAGSGWGAQTAGRAAASGADDVAMLHGRINGLEQMIAQVAKSTVQKSTANNMVLNAGKVKIGLGATALGTTGFFVADNQMDFQLSTGLYEAAKSDSWYYRLPASMLHHGAAFAYDAYSTVVSYPANSIAQQLTNIAVDSGQLDPNDEEGFDRGRNIIYGVVHATAGNLDAAATHLVGTGVKAADITDAYYKAKEEAPEADRTELLATTFSIVQRTVAERAQENGYGASEGVRQALDERRSERTGGGESDHTGKSAPKAEETRTLADVGADVRRQLEAERQRQFDERLAGSKFTLSKIMSDPSGAWGNFKDLANDVPGMSELVEMGEKYPMMKWGMIAGATLSLFSGKGSPHERLGGMFWGAAMVGIMFDFIGMMAGKPSATVNMVRSAQAAWNGQGTTPPTAQAPAPVAEAGPGQQPVNTQQAPAPVRDASPTVVQNRPAPPTPVDPVYGPAITAGVSAGDAFGRSVNQTGPVEVVEAQIIPVNRVSVDQTATSYQVPTDLKAAHNGDLGRGAFNPTVTAPAANDEQYKIAVNAPLFDQRRREVAIAAPAPSMG